jgi:hypothetical protein
MSKSTPGKGLFILIAVFIAIGILTILFFKSRSDSQNSREALIDSVAETQATPTPQGTVATSDTPPPMSASPTPTNALVTAEDRQKVAVLEEILASHNDNDPRLDKEFRNLTPGAKAALRGKYESTQIERRNDRGTVVFLLGREIKSLEDARFLAGVMGEPTCLSLEDCAHKPPGTVDEHAAMANEITVVYPQIVAVKSFERLLAPADSSTEVSPEVRSLAMDALRAAQNSDSQKVAQAARDAISKVSPR